MSAHGCTCPVRLRQAMGRLASGLRDMTAHLERRQGPGDEAAIRSALACLEAVQKTLDATASCQDPPKEGSTP